MTISRLMLIGLMVPVVPVFAAEKEKAVPHPDWPVVFQDDFQKDPTAKFQPTDAKAWKHAKDGEDGVYALAGKSDYRAPVRSPHNISLIKDLVVSDFVLDVDVKSTTREYGHRDLCFFLGHQDPTHFYYVHVATKADPHAHSIFLVNDEPRVSIAKERTQGVQWTDGYHHVRIVREAESGKIAVYFDDMTRPVMETNDKHFAHGRIGLGSFDDTGYFDNLVIRGKIYRP